MLIAAIAGWAMLASTAAAKEEAEALVVCGAARCREMSGGVAKLVAPRRVVYVAEEKSSPPGEVAW